ncbi:MAG: hypothetical protein ACPGUV_02995 [Polyangiales bacterium]
MDKGQRDVQRISANMPAVLLQESCRVTGKGITETLILGLQLIQRTAAAAQAKKLKGRLHLDLDLERSRQRNR